jgi:hypothetical protein
MRLDGLTDLRLERSAKAGSMTTIPIARGTASELYLNARCSESGYLQVEIIDASTGQVVPGFSRDESRRMTRDAVQHRAEWTSGKQLNALGAGSFQIRVYFAGSGSSPTLNALEFR